MTDKELRSLMCKTLYQYTVEDSGRTLKAVLDLADNHARTLPMFCIRDFLIAHGGLDESERVDLAYLFPTGSAK